MRVPTPCRPYALELPTASSFRGSRWRTFDSDQTSDLSHASQAMKPHSIDDNAGRSLRGQLSWPNRPIYSQEPPATGRPGPPLICAPCAGKPKLRKARRLHGRTPISLHTDDERRGDTTMPCDTFRWGDPETILRLSGTSGGTRVCHGR